MHHIDKLFPEAVWEYNHRVSGVKPGESKSKHFVHRALEVWSALYPDKPFGPNNKNIIFYSMAMMVYAEIELRTVWDEDSVGKTICFAKSGSRSEDEEGASASRKLDSTLPRLEGDIQDVGSVGGPNLNLITLFSLKWENI
jgi:hypothetical protein